MRAPTRPPSAAVPPAKAAAVTERTGARALLAGGAVLTAAMTVAYGGNYLLNVLLGRWLTPAAFADANLMVTLLLVVTAIAVALQMVAARFVGTHAARGSDGRGDALAHWLERVAAGAGVLIGVALAAPARTWAEVFQTESALPFVILGLGMPCYLAQAVGRGTLQGRLAFGRLAVTFVVEMLVRVGVALALVAAGFGVEGATWGLTASLVVTWIVVRGLRPDAGTDRPTRNELGELGRYVVPVLVLLIGQIIINNGDVLVVKSVFGRTEAGVYAAVALVGRAVFFLSWSAVTTLFPAAAQRDAAGHRADDLLAGGVAVVVGACGAMTLVVAVAGDQLLITVFGRAYAGVGYLLVWYAVATTFFAVANLLVTHQLSRGRWREAALLLAGAVLQTVLLLVHHDDLAAVVIDQVVAMSILLAVMIWRTRLRFRADLPTVVAVGGFGDQP